MKSRYIPGLFVGDGGGKKNEEAAEAIQTVIAQYGRSLEFYGFRSQVGAAVSSLKKISPKTLKKSMPRLVIRKAMIKTRTQKAGVKLLVRLEGSKKRELIRFRFAAVVYKIGIQATIKDFL